MRYVWTLIVLIAATHLSGAIAQAAPAGKPKTTTHTSAQSWQIIGFSSLLSDTHKQPAINLYVPGSRPKTCKIPDASFEMRPAELTYLDDSRTSACGILWSIQTH